MPTSVFTAAGDTAVPVEIVKALGLRADMKMSWTELPDGTVVVRAKRRTLSELRGILERPPGVRVGIDQMNR